MCQSFQNVAVRHAVAIHPIAQSTDPPTEWERIWNNMAKHDLFGNYSTILRVGKDIFDSRKPGKQKEAKIKARTAMSCLAKLVQATEGLAKVEELLIENKVFAWHWNWLLLPGEDALYFVSMDISETFNASCLFDEILALIKFACLVAADSTP